MEGEIVKAVAGEMVSRGTSLLIHTYNHKCRTDLEEKLDRVDMLVRKFQSISEVSDSYEIETSNNLCRLKEKFDDAARQGDDMIRLFKERADREKKSEEDSQSGYSIASIPKNAAKAAKRLKRWFSHDDDINKLDDVLNKLESTNDEVPIFLMLVKMNRRSRESSAIRKAKRTKPVPGRGYLELQAKTIKPVPAGQVYLQAKTTKPVPAGQVYLQAETTKPVPGPVRLQAMADQKMYCVRKIRDLPILSHLFGLAREVAFWAIAVAAIMIAVAAIMIAVAAIMIAVAAMLLCIWLSSKYSNNNNREIRVEQLITVINNRIRDVEQQEIQSPILADWLKKVREVTSEAEIELRFLKGRKYGLKDSSNRHTVCLGRLLSRLETAAKDTKDICEALTVARGQFAYMHMPYCNGGSE